MLCCESAENYHPAPNEDPQTIPHSTITSYREKKNGGTLGVSVRNGGDRSITHEDLGKV